MNIIIVGCGKVGFTLAETLSSEGHDISVVDNKEDALSRLSALDVISITVRSTSSRMSWGFRWPSTRNWRRPARSIT